MKFAKAVDKAIERENIKVLKLAADWGHQAEIQHEANKISTAVYEQAKAKLLKEGYVEGGACVSANPDLCGISFYLPGYPDAGLNLNVYNAPAVLASSLGLPRKV